MRFKNILTLAGRDQMVALSRIHYLKTTVLDLYQVIYRPLQPPHLQLQNPGLAHPSEAVSGPSGKLSICIAPFNSGNQLALCLFQSSASGFNCSSHSPSSVPASTMTTPSILSAGLRQVVPHRSQKDKVSLSPPPWVVMFSTTTQLDN